MIKKEEQLTHLVQSIVKKSGGIEKIRAARDALSKVTDHRAVLERLLEQPGPQGAKMLVSQAVLGLTVVDMLHCKINRVCPECGGSGVLWTGSERDEVCEECKGSGVCQTK